MRFQEPTRIEMFLDGWNSFLSALETYGSEDKYDRMEFWYSLSSGWMDIYVYPYDDPFNPSQLSLERKSRLGK